jgi:Fe-S-cluster-containing dehydrogenase component
MIRLNFEGKIAQKCNLCIDIDGGPICVRSCPSSALEFKSLEEVRAEALKKTAREIVEAQESAA